MPACRVCEGVFNVYEQVGYNRGTNKDAMPGSLELPDTADDPLGSSKESLMDTIVSDPHHCQYCHPQFVTEYPNASNTGGAL